MGATVELIGFGEKDSLWRWDTNRQIRIIPETGATIDEIRFSNIFLETPLKVEPKTNEHGDIVADIPNILLQEIFPIDVQVIMFFNNGKQTIYNTSYKVENCKKPPEYVYTETEIKNYDDLEKRIAELEKGGIGGGSGEPGADGYSPEAKVEETADGAKITITDKNGTTEATVKNGKDGKDGLPGTDGKDGLNGKDGVDGKSAYQYAKDGGYTGTEEEFAHKMAEEIGGVEITDGEPTKSSTVMTLNPNAEKVKICTEEDFNAFKEEIDAKFDAFINAEEVAY